MDATLKAELLRRLTLPHKHEAMQDALKCKECGVQYKEAEAWFQVKARQHPELFVRKAPEMVRSEKYAEMANQLEDRLKRDPMYKEHLKVSAFGTPEEKAREARRANSGFYKRNSDYQKKW